MKKYNIYTFEVSHPRLGLATIDIDYSEGTTEGWYRQRVKFNPQMLPAVGRWTAGRVSGSELLLFDESPDATRSLTNPFGIGDKPFVILRGVNKSSAGSRGAGDRITPQYDNDIKWQLKKITPKIEYSFEDIASKIIDAKWRFVSSAGVNASGGVGRFGVTGNLGKFFVKGDSEVAGTQHEIKYATAGASAGASLAPITVSRSLASMPSGGIGRIFSLKKNLSLFDFQGFCTILEASGFATGVSGAGLYAIFFHSAPLVHPTLLLVTTKCFGFMWGTIQGAGASIGGSISTGSCFVMN